MKDVKAVKAFKDPWSLAMMPCRHSSISWTMKFKDSVADYDNGK